MPYSDAFYDAYDVLDYGEMTKLGYDSLVREVMTVGVVESYKFAGMEKVRRPGIRASTKNSARSEAMIWHEQVLQFHERAINAT